MIESLRKLAGSWVAKLLLGLLVISFAAWGIGDMLRGSSVSTAATVGGKDISTQDFARGFESFMRSNPFARGMTPAQARSLGFDRAVLGGMAQNAAVEEEAKALGFAAADSQVTAAIRSERTFHNAVGEFDEAAFERAMRQAGLRQTEYYETVREDLTRNMLTAVVATGARMSRTAAEAIWAQQNETREISYVAISPSLIDAPEAPSDDVLSAYHLENKERFTAPEYRSISYLWLDASSRADVESVSDDEALALYESRADRYQTEETRNIEQLAFDNEEAAQEAAAKLADGVNFEQLVTERGLTPADVELGYVSRADLFDEAAAEVVFGETTEGVVGPVQGGFGWTLFNIRGVRPSVVVTFEDVQDELKQEIAEDRARADLPDLANAVEDLRAAGATLEEVADNERLQTITIVVDAQGLGLDGVRPEGLPTAPIFLERAFELEISEEMDMEELPGLEFFVLRVDSVTPAALRPLEEAQSAVLEAWSDQRRKDLLSELAETLRERVKSGESLQNLATELETPLATLEALRRDGAPADLSDVSVAALFAGDEGDAMVLGGRTPGAQVLAIVEKITPADLAAGAEEIDRLVQASVVQLGQDVAATHAQEALDQQGFQINQAAIDYALGGGAHGGY